MQIERDKNIANSNILDYLPHTWVVDDFVINKDMSTSAGFMVEVSPFYTLSAPQHREIHSKLSGWLNSLPQNISVQFHWDVSHNVIDILDKIEEQRDGIYNNARNAYVAHLNKLEKDWAAEAERRERAGDPPPPQPDIPEFKLSESEELANNYLSETGVKWKNFSEAAALRRYKLYIILTMAPMLTNAERIKRAKEDAKFEANNPLFPEKSPKGFLNELFSSFSTPEPAHYYTTSEWDDILMAWAPVLDALKATIDGLGYSAKRMGEQDIVATLFRFWAPKSAETIGAPDVSEAPLAMLPELYLSDSVTFNRKTGAIRSDGCVHRVLTLECPASTLNLNTFSQILEEQFIPNLQVTVNILPYDRTKRIAELQKELPLLRGRIAKDPKLAVAVEQIESEIYSLQASQECCWKAAIFFHVWGENDAEADKYVSELKRLGRTCGNSLLVSETVAAWRYMVAMLPFWGRDTDMYRHFHVSTIQIVCLLPLTGHSERLTGEPISMLLETANASVFNYNPMDNMRLNNYNTLICGGSGTGKSFLAGSILLNMLLKNARVICIDIGASYQSLCEAFNGSYISMDPTSRMQTINPLARTAAGNTAAARFNAIRWLEVALLDKGQILEKDVQSDLDNALSQLYSRFGNAENSNIEPTLSDLRQLLQNFDSPKIQDLAKRMELYCQGGQHGALFDGQTKIDLENQFIVFDLTLIKDHPDLGPLTLMSVMNNVERMASNYPKQAKVLLLDEAWALLNTPSGAKFVVEAFRTYRKLNVAILGISQEVADWTGGNLKGVVSNVSSYFVLTQANSGTLASAAEIVGFTPEEVSIAGNLQKEKGKYSQALLIQKCQGTRLSTVIVNRTTPLQYALMTTDGRDKAEIRRIMESEQCSNLQARLIFSERFPSGV